MIEILTRVLYPLRIPFIASSQIYWLYIISAIVLATLLYILNTANRDSRKNLLEFLFPKAFYLHPSAITEYKYYFVASLLNAFVVSPLILLVSSEKIQHVVCSILTHIIGINAPLAIPHTQLWHHILYSIFLALVGDFAAFFYHYLSHKIPILWEFHKVHHSGEVITPMSVYRGHPVEIFLASILTTIISAVATGVWIYLFGTQMNQLLIYGVSCEIFLSYLAGYNLRHSHIWLSYPAWISHIFISPAQHQIHHSVDPKHYDRNFGNIFAFWDLIFGTLYVPCGYEKVNFGLSDGELQMFNSVGNLFLQPFKAIWQRYKKISVEWFLIRDN